MDNLSVNTWNTPAMTLRDHFDDTCVDLAPTEQQASSLDLLDLPVESLKEHQALWMSLSFFPGARGSEANIIFCTSDFVLFFVDAAPIFHTSDTAFRELLAGTDTHGVSPAMVYIPETSLVMDVMLHFLLPLPFSEGTPQPSDILDGVARMSKYGVNLVALLTPTNPCYHYILNLAPALPLELYTLAARFNIRHLAVTASSHLLSLALPAISDETADIIGPVYLLQLFTLHSHRGEKLKSILAKTPHPHPPTLTCDFDEQKKLARAWTMVAGYFIWDGKFDLSPSTIQLQFEGLNKHLACNLCREMLAKRLKDAIAQWVQVKRTI